MLPEYVVSMNLTSEKLSVIPRDKHNPLVDEAIAGDDDKTKAEEKLKRIREIGVQAYFSEVIEKGY